MFGVLFIIFVEPSVIVNVAALFPFLLIVIFISDPTGAVSTRATILLNVVVAVGEYHLFVPVVTSKSPVCFKFT